VLGEGSDVFLRLPTRRTAPERECLESRPWVAAAHD
jgi:hypothetical protein